MPKDANLIKDYRLPILTAHTDMKFEVVDSSEEDEGEEEEEIDLFKEA